MIYEMARDLDASLAARKFPVHVQYGPERAVRENFGQVILIERDRTASDTIEPPSGQQRNPRRIMTRKLAVRATIFARSSLPGAMVSDHERECERLVDALLVALYNWQTEAKAGAVTLREARYLAASERNDVETWPGVVYMLGFFVPRAVLVLDWDGAAKPTYPLQGFANTDQVRLAGRPNDPPETGC